MISAEEARSLIRESAAAATKPATEELVGLVDAPGRRLARGLTASVDLPPFDNSAMDGFALNSRETRAATPENPVSLKVTARISAGLSRGSNRMPVGPGETQGIMTGAPLPPGADAVVPIEETEMSPEGALLLKAPVSLGRSIRRRGEDVRSGDVVFAPEVLLTPADLGLLAAQGFASVPVLPRLRVALFCTGDELLDASKPLKEGHLRDSNSPMLRAALALWGCEVFWGGRIEDEPEVLEAAFRRAEEFDPTLVLFTGGVSMGDWDFGRPVLEKLGARIVFHKVALKPGKPLLFADWGGRLVFGLPGNPVSSYLTFLVFVQEALSVLCGPLHRFRTEAIAGASFFNNEGPPKTLFLRAQTESPLSERLVPAQLQGSHMLSSLAGCKGFVEVPAGTKEIAAGQKAVFYPVWW